MSLVGFPLSHKMRAEVEYKRRVLLHFRKCHPPYLPQTRKERLNWRIWSKDPQTSISVLCYQKTDVNRNIAEYNTNHAAGKSSLAPKPPRDLTKMCGQKKCAQTPCDLTKMCPRRNALRSTSYLVAMAATRYKKTYIRARITPLGCRCRT